MHRDMFKIQDGVAIVEKLNSKVDFETLFCEVEAWNLGAIFVV